MLRIVLMALLISAIPAAALAETTMFLAVANAAPVPLRTYTGASAKQDCWNAISLTNNAGNTVIGQSVGSVVVCVPRATIASSPLPPPTPPTTPPVTRMYLLVAGAAPVLVGVYSTKLGCDTAMAETNTGAANTVSLPTVGVSVVCVPGAP